MIFAPRLRASPSSMVFTISTPIAAPCSSASLTRPLLSLSLPSALGGSGREASVIPARRITHPRRHWWQQLRGPGRMERPTATVLRSFRSFRHGGSLSHRSIEIQSHRASPVQHDQQELGRRTAHQLRENSEVHPHHHHQYGAQSAGLSGSQELPRRRKAIATEAASVAPHTIQSSSQMELHHRPLKCEVIVAPILSRSQTISWTNV